MRNSAEALEKGALKLMGKPCAKGHDGLRYARSLRCVHCVDEINARDRGMTKRDRHLRRQEQDRQLLAMVIAAEQKRKRQATARQKTAVQNLLLLCAVAG